MRHAIALMVLLGACSVSEHEARTCETDADCVSGTCFRGFCVGGSDGGTDGSTDAPMLDSSSDVPMLDAGTMCEEDREGCYDGPYVDGRIVGRCRTGVELCDEDGFLTECMGQQLPRDETCNGVDDDCNGEVDDIVADACDSGLPGACMAGTLTCIPGGGERCVADVMPSEEIPCNLIDDDCDGQTDEFDEPTCYPDGESGCDAGTCVGQCLLGRKQCADGAEVCSDAVTPVVEDDTLCDGSDNDCDGSIDEECSCTPTTMGDCYSGGAGTEDVGECAGGMRTCEAGGTWGACMDETLPVAEDCSNLGQDDDCDGSMDENIGFDCSTGMPGICEAGMMICAGASETCAQTVTAEDEACNGLDDDCDGEVDEDFDTQTDEQNCGACGRTCSGSRTCCAGACVNTASDSDNCGSCGNSCAICVASICI